MLERLAILAAVAVLITLSVVAIRAWNARGTKQLLRQPLLETLGAAPDGRATLVSISTPSCAACHSAQAPAIKTVQQRFGQEKLRVIKIDAAEQPEKARAVGVLTVPSTVVFDPSGQLVAINQGFAPAAKLLEQLQRT
jgi:thiol-disulfide isomerase/thioredoxin